MIEKIDIGSGRDMEIKGDTVRRPKQKRSIRKKELIQKTALRLFCESGFYTITTNQIAKEAGLSVGTLYEYYKNKEDILYDILDDYYTEFINQKDNLVTNFKMGVHSENKREWLKAIFDDLIRTHKNSVLFNIELHNLYFRLDRVKEICTAQKRMFQKIVYESLVEIKDELVTEDIETAAILFFDVIDTVVDRIVLYPVTIPEDRIIEQAIDLLCMYLFGKK